MLNMSKKSPEEASSSNDTTEPLNILGWIKGTLRGKPDASLREALQEYIVDGEEGGVLRSSVAEHEKTLLSNILKLRDMAVFDVMVPRADIAAMEVNTSQEDLLKLLAEKQYSRFPVYRETLDHVLGTVHIKDIVAKLAKNKPVFLKELVREIPIVSPAMHVLDLLLQMRQSRRHMVLVVDEFGGIDGLITIGDVIEAIVGEIDDEHDINIREPEIIEAPDGTIIADARVDIDQFEARFGKILTEDEREESDTLGGLVFSLAGRVPVRGEVLTHQNGMVFEVLDADPRRVSRLQIRNIPRPEQKT